MRDLLNIVERSINTIDFDDLAERLSHEDGIYDTCQFDYNIENNRDEDDDISDEDQADFKEFVLDWCRDTLHNSYYKFQHLFKDGVITLYRVITAPVDWKPDERHPGIYWSWDKHAAEAHWGDFRQGNVKWRMTTQVKSEDIDWDATLLMNANPSYEEEREIRILEKPITLTNVERLK
jgi:hypothetical protein